MWDDNHRLGARHSFQSGSISALDSVIMCLCFINECSSIWDQAKAHLACILVCFPACCAQLLSALHVRLVRSVPYEVVSQPMRCRWQGSLLAFGKEMFKELPNASSIWVDLHMFSGELKGKKGNLTDMASLSSEASKCAGDASMASTRLSKFPVSSDFRSLIRSCKAF